VDRPVAAGFARLVSSETNRLRRSRQRWVSLGVALSGRVFISTPSDDVAALALLRSTGWTLAGELTGMGAGHDVEAFFYRDLDTGERPAG